MDVFVSGLSGETAQVILPKPVQVSEIDSAGKPVSVVKDKIILSRTLQRHYTVQGRWTGGAAEAKFDEESWVMR